MSQMSYRGLRAVTGAAMVAIGLASAGPALAQSEVAGPAMSLEEIQSCLCLEQSIEALRRETELQQSLREERTAELNEIDRQIEQARATMDVGDPAAIEELQRLVARQQMLRDLLRTDVRRPLSETVDALNTRVAAYNEQCTTRPMFKLEVERARENLQCPPQ